eukprot:gnl/MRDRNA2_/MRDRNA2_66473_c0_seq1.p1 gnl/MRDRNA2_/MRDRNA2_66473_c0~~gnl/MRDRNA2_/MRDRNA2_66473_c0_seq1.p1  ORF type:complete len:362 (+),score=44.80 gnl/MRDRNA2_/MRDRNA2_66473_c0_seq1:246-1331(+)
MDGPGPPHFQGLHTDAYHNVYLQINGTKTFQLIAPWRGYNMKLLTDNYLSITEHWRQSAVKDLLSTIDVWKRLGAGPDQAPGLDPMPRMSVALEPGDVLVLPRQWWHTALNSGDSNSLAISIWFSTRHPFMENWWHMSMQLLETSEKRRRKEEKDKYQPPSKSKSRHEEFQTTIRRKAPWFNFEFLWKSKINHVGDLKEGKPGMPSVASDDGECIRWRVADLKTLKANLASKPHLNMTRIMKILNTKIGKQNAWDLAGKVYLRDILGGTKWQPLDEWRRKVAKKKKREGEDDLFEDEDLMPKVARHWFSDRNAEFFALFPGCRDSDSVAQPLCEEHYREVVVALESTARCETAPCRGRLEL